MPNDPTNAAGGSPNPNDPNSGIIDIPSSGVHPSLAGAPHPAQSQSYEVTVNGQKEQWGLDRLIAEAQQGAAGRAKFQEASEMRKQNAASIAIHEDLHEFIQSEDEDAFRRLGARMGVPASTVEDTLERFRPRDDDDDDDPVESYRDQVRASRGKAPVKTNDPIGYGQFTPDVQLVLREAERTRIEGIVGGALDKDEDIRYNMEAHSPEGRAAIRRFVDEKIRGRLDSDVYRGQFGDGTRILSEVIPEIRDHLKALGTPGKRTTTGLGQAPGGGDTEVYPSRLPDYVPSSEGDSYEQNILDTLRYHQSQAERGRQ